MNIHISTPWRTCRHSGGKARKLCGGNARG